MINERLKTLRKDINITQNKVAEYIGVARATYTNYESGKKKPPHEQLIKLAEFFEVSTDYLLGITDIKSPIYELEGDSMFSEKLKELRKLKNISQQKLADELGIKSAVIDGYETKRREPSIELLNKLADYFNISTDYLTGREELTPDQELATILSDPKMHVAFQDYDSWTNDDKRELIAYLKAKDIARKSGEK